MGKNNSVKNLETVGDDRHSSNTFSTIDTYHAHTPKDSKTVEPTARPTTHSEAYTILTARPCQNPDPTARPLIYTVDGTRRTKSKPIRDHIRTHTERYPTHTGRLPATHHDTVVRVHRTVHHMKPQDYIGLYILVTIITLASVNYLYRLYF